VEIDYFVIKNFLEMTIDHSVVDERVASDHRLIQAEFEFK